jgi:hypothetical protein
VKTQTMKCNHDPLLANMVCGMCVAVMVRDAHAAGVEAAAKYVEDKWWAHLPSGDNEDERMVAGIRALAPREAATGEGT